MGSVEACEGEMPGGDISFVIVVVVVAAFIGDWGSFLKQEYFQKVSPQIDRCKRAPALITGSAKTPATVSSTSLQRSH